MNYQEETETSATKCAKCGSLIITTNAVLKNPDLACKTCNLFISNVMKQLITHLHAILFEEEEQEISKNCKHEFVANCVDRKCKCKALYTFTSKPCPTCRKVRNRIVFKSFFLLLKKIIFFR